MKRACRNFSIGIKAEKIIPPRAGWRPIGKDRDATYF